MSYFNHHLFFCTNRRDDGRQSCGPLGGDNARDYVKRRCKELEIHDVGQVRANATGCLARCELGPVLVIYPEETWYTYVDREDLEEIIQEHLLNGRVVERLRLPSPVPQVVSP